MNGKVYLVGAGPGDPDLLTLKALRLLKTADVVLHDELVSLEVLALVSAQAMLVNVGKRCGKKRITQEEINSQMISLAASGLNVVRLKSGDPSMFGRAGEEVQALRLAQVHYEIVPGVTSALGAAATSEIPLTHRQLSPALVFVTGHRAPENDRLDWRPFVASGATLVIYMPGHDYRGISRRLKRAGMRGQISCAIVSRATTAAQQVQITTLDELPASRRMPSPTLLIIGDVVRFAAQPADLRIPGDINANTSPQLQAWVTRAAELVRGGERVA